jgi:hypothetical protein
MIGLWTEYMLSSSRYLPFLPFFNLTVGPSIFWMIFRRLETAHTEDGSQPATRTTRASSSTFNGVDEQRLGDTVRPVPVQRFIAESLKYHKNDPKITEIAAKATFY